MEYKKEDWVVGRMYKFIGDDAYNGDPEAKFSNPGFVIGEVYRMVSEIYEYGDTDCLSDALFYIPGDDLGHWYELCAFVPVEQS